jgi:MarR family 2-MHQ and catechol resistance regulon transcriptional repressor
LYESIRADDASLKLFVVLSKAHKAITEHAIKDIKRYNMTITEFTILELLYHKESFPMQQIGEKVLIPSESITYNIDKLVDKGLLRRQPYPTDRRVIYAVITEQGKNLFSEIMLQHTQVIHSALSGLNEHEKQETIRLIKKLGIHAKSLLI